MRADIGQEHRYAHSVRVARCAELLAHAHALDPQKARLAGMLHDLARLYPGPRLIAECEARNMPVDAFERVNPTVLHARLGARLARENYGVGDPEILSAIEKHTLAGSPMSALDCAVYLADGLEPARDFPERSACWRLAVVDLRAAMRVALASTIAYLGERGIPVAPQTAAAARKFESDHEEAPPSLI